jgi:chitin synthase
MATAYHRPPSADGESDDEGNVFEHPYDPNASTDRIPLTQAMPGNAPYSTSAPPVPSYGERPTSRYTLSESYVPAAGQSSSTNLGGGFGTGRVQFPEAIVGRPGSAMSNMTEDWIQRQQPVAAAQADLRRYQTRRVKLNQGHVFSADYPYSSSPLSVAHLKCSERNQKCR